MSGPGRAEGPAPGVPPRFQDTPPRGTEHHQSLAHPRISPPATAPRTERSRRRPRSRTWLLAVPVLAVLLWTVVYPNLAVVVGSFASGLGLWRDFAHSPADREALVNTIIIAIGSVISATAVGLPLAFLLTRVEFRGRRVLSAVATLPAALPPLVGVIAFLFLYGESGVVTHAVQLLFGLDHAPWTLNGLWAIIFVHAYTMYVYVFLFVSAALERFDTSLEEAASGLGASRRRTLWRVTLPMLGPSLLGAMLLVFMSAMGSFSAPYIFGGGIRVLSTQIVASKLNGSIGMAYVETTVLAVSALLALGLLRWFERRRQYTMAGRGGGTRRVRLRSPVWRVLAPVLAALLVVLLVLPHAMVILVSFAKDGTWTTQILPPQYTLENFRRLATQSELWVPIRNSVGMTVLATAADIVVCFFAAYLIVLRRFTGRRLLRMLVALPWAIPGTAIALGLAATFDRNALFAARVLLVGTFWILPLAYFIRGIPLVATATEGSLAQIDPSLEDAARGLGSSWWLTMRRVILPAARPGLVAGAMLAAVTAVGEFVASIVLYTHANRPISMAILAQLRDFAFGTAAAYSVLLIVLVLLIALAARFTEGRFARAETISAG